MQNAVGRQYLKQIQRCLPCSSSEKRRFLRDLKHNVSLFTLENPQITLEELNRQFGTPEEIRNSFPSGETISYRQMEARWKHRLLSISCIIALSLLAIMLIALIYHVFDLYAFSMREALYHLYEEH